MIKSLLKIAAFLIAATMLLSLAALGYICTDFLHKKEKVAKNLISFFLEHYRKREVNMVMLYPFNIPFYKKWDLDMQQGCTSSG